jgi:hypothetical protein
MKIRLMVLLFLAAQVACGGGSKNGADADADGVFDPDLNLDADMGSDEWIDCGSVPAAGVLESRVPPGAWPDFTWEDPTPGAWETIDVTTRGVAPSSGDISEPLQALIDGLTAPTILSFPPGVYELHASVEMKGDLILSGAGTGATRIELVGINRAFTWSGVGGQWSWGWIDEEYQPRNVTADVPAMDDTIPLESTAGLGAGDIVLVAESLENPSFPSAKLAKGGMFALTAVTADSVTVDLPLTIGLRTQNDLGEATVVAKVQPIRNGGVEHLEIVSPTLTGYNGGVFDMYLADNIFIRDVVSRFSFGADVLVSNSRRVLVTQCFFDRTQGSPPDGGESIWIDQLNTRVLVADNILREKQPPLVAQVGGNMVVYAYNFHVDRLADYCHETSDPNCRELDWIRDEEVNGIARGWHGLADVVFHGNYPHHYLIEGNVFYNAVFDYHHFENGPGTTIFRNRILGNPWVLTWWMNGYGIWLDGPHDGQNLVGNVLLHDSIITFELHNGPSPPEDMFVAANTLSGAVDWGDLEEGAALPPSLYRSCPPSFWPADLPWPPFGPDVPDSATNIIPAQIRYEEIEATEP